MIPRILLLCTLIVALALAAPRVAAGAECRVPNPPLPRAELAPFVGTWGGHLIDVFVQNTGLVVISWPVGREVNSGTFTGARDAEADTTVLWIAYVDGNAAAGCIVASSDGRDPAGGPVLLSIGNDGLLTIRFSGGTTQVERS
jgi:hypothetical protein